MSINIQAVPNATLNYSVAEEGTPYYVDTNLKIVINGAVADIIGITGSRSLSAPTGQNINFVAYCQFAPTGGGINPIITLSVQRNGTTIYSSTTPAIIGASLSYSEAAISGATYTIVTTSSASAPYQNVMAQQAFVRNNCGTGYTGTSVNYIVPAGTYTSAISQADANNQAAADITANGQNYANNPANGATCLVNTTVATLFVDYYTDSDADLCCYINTSGVTENNQIVWSGSKLYPNTGIDPSVCFLAASDRLSQASPKRRFGINLGVLISKYPAIDIFTFIIRGRSLTAGAVSGVYVLKQADQGQLVLVTSSTSGELIPSTTNPSNAGIVSYSSDITNGGDGTVGVGIGSPILQLVYTVSTNIIAATTY